MKDVERLQLTFGKSLSSGVQTAPSGKCSPSVKWQMLLKSLTGLASTDDAEKQNLEAM